MSYEQFGPYVKSFGPDNARIMCVGEAPGSEESDKLRPFVGPSGHELRRMLRTVGLSIHDCFLANTFSRMPAANNLALYTDETLRSCPLGLGPLTTAPAGYMAAAHSHELDRLYAEIAHVNPNVIIALGNTACWALGLGGAITSLRGTLHTASVPGITRRLKVIPTFHPAAVLRQWSLRVVALADLSKAAAESLSPIATYDHTELWLTPTLSDLADFDRLHMSPATICACDIETRRGQIDCISFAPTPDVSISIPFYISGPDPNYWPTPTAERHAWNYVRKWLERADLVKVFQNGLFDLTYLQHFCTPRNCTADTMLAHHSLYSELQKGLGFLGSIYGNYPAWKRLRTDKRAEQLKKDD